MPHNQGAGQRHACESAQLPFLNLVRQIPSRTETPTWRKPRDRFEEFGSASVRPANCYADRGRLIHDAVSAVQRQVKFIYSNCLVIAERLYEPGDIIFGVANIETAEFEALATKAKQFSRGGAIILCQL